MIQRVGGRGGDGEFSLIVPVVQYLTKTVCRNLTLVFVVCFLHVHT